MDSNHRSRVTRPIFECRLGSIPRRPKKSARKRTGTRARKLNDLNHSKCPNRPSQAKIIEHHNFIWSDLIAPGGAVHVATCKELMSGAS